MASIVAHGSGWRVFIFKRGIRESRTFGTKAEARSWGSAREVEIEAGVTGPVDKTVRDLLQEYAKKVSGEKKGAKWERTRIDLICRMPIADVRLADLGAPDIGEWRDARLKQVSAASVRREWTILSGAFSIAIDEWKWLNAHPMTKVRRPPKPRPRDRTFTEQEVERLLFVTGSNLGTVMGRTGAALRLALETGMRAGELCSLSAADVDLKAQVAVLRDTKNGDSREVPLSPQAVEICKSLATDAPLLLRLNTQQIDAHFRKAKAKACVEGVTFHDSRATAITRLARKLDILDLARMVGHRDIRSLQVYYRTTAADIAKLL